ncbi:hypothetical protein G9A89_014536 [Geosiphon pyriformis]|nr:hypothetical protein G9A89_014536 [Geosiphon pyriformis]
MSSACLSRIYREIKELYDEPMKGIQVFIQEDVTCMCLILTPQQGPFHGLRLHLDVKVPENYPRAAPDVTIQTLVSHPNVLGDGLICCDILQAHEKLGMGPDIRSMSYNGGYTPGYLLKYIFLQLLSFFSEDDVEQSGGYKYSIGDLYSDLATFRTRNKDAVQFYKCSKCGFNDKIKVVLSENELINADFGASIIEVDLPSITVEKAENQSKQMPPSISKDILSDDCWLHIIELLSERDIVILSEAYPRVNRIVRAYNILIRRQLICFYLRKPFQQCILGVGVHASGNNISKRALTINEFDFFSYEAFKNHSLREGVWGQSFTHFLPVVLNNSHFERALPIIKTTLMELREPPKSKWTPLVILRTIPGMMNMMVVNLMQACDQDRHGGGKILQASEKALQGYCLLLHLFLKLSEHYPQIQKEAQQKIILFIKKRENRLKQATPNLGEFIIYLLLAKDIDWPKFFECFLQELFARNVVWYLGSSPHLGYLEPSTYKSEKRIQESFDASGTSLRLVMFQILFLRMTQASGDMSRRYGFPSGEMSQSLLQLIKQIYAVKSFDVFFKILDLPLPQNSWKTAITEMLIKAVQESYNNGYHQQPYTINELYYLRKLVEPAIPPPSGWDPNSPEVKKLDIYGCARGLSFNLGERNKRENDEKRRGFNGHNPDQFSAHGIYRGRRPYRGRGFQRRG